MDTAVLVIDVQQLFCAGPLAVENAPGLLQRINTVTRAARQAEAPVIFIQHETEEGPLSHGSAGWQFADGLRIDMGDLRVPKTTSDAFLRTNLRELLASRHVQRLVVCGLHTQFCIDTTVRRALALGYPVTLVADAHAAMENPVLTAEEVVAHHNFVLTNITSFGPRATAVRTADLDWRVLSPLPSA